MMTDDSQAPSAAGPSTDYGHFAETPSGRNPTPRRLPKKRTKTGCLTCRKRRIKCGEEKPICSNCVKSKRICEGYAQRVIFKNPLGISGGFGPPPQSQDPHMLLLHQQQQQQQQQHMRMPLFHDYSLPAQQAAVAAQHPMLAPRPIDASTSGHQPYPPSQAAPSQETQTANAPQFYYPAPPVQFAPWSSQPIQPDGQGRTPSTTTSDSDWQSSAVSSGQSSTQYKSDTAKQKVQADVHFTNPPTQYSTSNSASPSTDGIAGEKRYVPHPSHLSSAVYYHQQPPAQLPPHVDRFGQFTQSQPQVIYVEDETEDYYDVESDEEMVNQTQPGGSNQLTRIMASANHDDGSLRSFTTHLNEPNILATYYPTLGSSPLNNPKTARIFAHFIHSTGPSLSIFERHPTDSSIVLGGSVPPAQQGLWTYTLPLKALEHPALLQAILAVSSLHIAYLQGVPTTVSLKHYHYALKCIGRAVSLPLRRKQIGTLAATELLGYYEVISADHSKWNSHVAGATLLIKETDFAGITRDLRAHRRRVREQRRQMGWSDSMYYPAFGSDGSEDDPFAEKEGSVDEALVGLLLGRVVNYDEFGLVDEGYTRSPKRHFSRKDIENFRIQCDLYWWFTKQDVFHSLISGDKLFMPYYLHGQCPPRAGIGRIDAIYGSADHLWLLLARVSDFGYRDRRRKLKALRAAGTDWRPGPGFFRFMGSFAGGDVNKRPGPPGGSRPPPSGPPPGSSQGAAAPGQGAPPPQSQDGPPMYGMIPPKGPARLPSGFMDGRREQRESPEEDDDSTYNDADQEWEEILAALDTFSQALGREFQPLPPDVTSSISTPFGPALQYRTHTIAVIWGFYYAARILLHRLHPSMPPAMMMAAGVAAPTTAEYAQIVGRITAGIYYPQRYNLRAGSLSPTLGSSLTEMTMPIFFAAVQYVDPAQRGWTIAKLRDVSRLTGWKTSDAIAGGCEKAWIVAAKHGRGPPYERSFENERDRPRHPQDVLNRDEEAQYSEDRRFVTVTGPDRAYLAMGLLSLEGDIQNLEL